MIRHIVTWKLTAQNEPDKSAAFDAIAGAFRALPALIPAVKSLQLGLDVGETASNWDVALLVDFDSTSDLEAYQAHPEHEKVKTIVRSLTSERASIDFEL
jgi:hypothetical protein